VTIQVSLLNFDNVIYKYFTLFAWSNVKYISILESQF